MADPVTALIRVCVLAPGFRLHQSLRTRHDFELTVLEDFPNQHGFMSMLVARVHHDFSARREELLTIYSLAHSVNVGLPSLFHLLLPDMDAEIGGLDRVVRHPLFS